MYLLKQFFLLFAVNVVIIFKDLGTTEIPRSLGLAF